METELVDEEGGWNKHDWRSRRIRVKRRIREEKEAAGLGRRKLKKTYG